MEMSKKVEIIRHDMMKLAEKHGTGKSSLSLEAFIYATALTLLTYMAGTKSNNIKQGTKESCKMLKKLGKHFTREKLK
jgi:hypothetical protein